MSRFPDSKLTPGERLQRKGQESKPLLRNLIVIGASAGGHRALVEILKYFSVDTPTAMVILLHVPLGSAYSLKESLGRFSRVPIIDVKEQETVQEGFILVPPAGRSATFSDGLIRVEEDSPPRPVSTINRLFISAAQNYGERVIGVILTGLLKDGTDGLRAVHQAGGLTIVQDPEEAEYPDMPTNAMKELPVTFCLKVGRHWPRSGTAGS